MTGKAQLRLPIWLYAKSYVEREINAFEYSKGKSEEKQLRILDTWSKPAKSATVQTQGDVKLCVH